MKLTQTEIVAIHIAVLEGVIANANIAGIGAGEFKETGFPPAFYDGIHRTAEAYIKRMEAGNINDEHPNDQNGH